VLFGSEREGKTDHLMAIEKHLSLNAAAKQAGVGRDALKRWLAKDLGICFPRVPHGSKILVRERDVEFVLAKRRDARAVRGRMRE